MATTVHSPNRKPRTRRKIRLNVQEVLMEQALKALPSVVGAEPKLSQVEQRIAEIIGIPVSTLHTWREDYALFGDRFDEIVGAVKARAGASLATVLPEAVEVIKETIRGEQKSPLRFDAAFKTAKGFGVVPADKVEAELKAMVGIFNADDLAREWRATKKRLAEASPESLGVPHRTSKDK